MLQSFYALKLSDKALVTPKCSTGWLKMQFVILRIKPDVNRKRSKRRAVSLP